MRFTATLNTGLGPVEAEIETTTAVADAAYLDLLTLTFENGLGLPCDVLTPAERQQILDAHPQVIGEALDNAIHQRAEDERLARLEDDWDRRFDDE